MLRAAVSTLIDTSHDATSTSDDAHAVEHAADAIRRMIVSTPLPASLAAGDSQPRTPRLAHGELVAVRSSAVSEDGATASFAGQQESYLNVRGAEAVLDRVRECWASFFSPRALFYRAQKAVLGDTRMAVVVQEMVQADKSGVMFTVDPIRNRRDCMVIEGAPGWATRSCRERSRPIITWSRATDGVVVEAFIPDEERGRVLSGCRTESASRHLGCGSKHSSDLRKTSNGASAVASCCVLQSRPITTLGAHG